MAQMADMLKELETSKETYKMLISMLEPLLPSSAADVERVKGLLSQVETRITQIRKSSITLVISQIGETRAAISAAASGDPLTEEQTWVLEFLVRQIDLSVPMMGAVDDSPPDYSTDPANG